MTSIRIAVLSAGAVASVLLALAACAAPATHTQSSPDGRGSASVDEHTYPDPLDLAAAHIEAIEEKLLDTHNVPPGLGLGLAITERMAGLLDHELVLRGPRADRWGGRGRST